MDGVFRMATVKKEPLPRQPDETHEEFLDRVRHEFFVEGIRDGKKTVRKGYCWWDSNEPGSIRKGYVWW